LYEMYETFEKISEKTYIPLTSDEAFHVGRIDFAF